MKSGLRLAWTHPSARITHSVWGSNLTDLEDNIYRVPNVRGDSLMYAQGRQIDAGVAVDF
jgi:hypothetical protein